MQLREGKPEEAGVSSERIRRVRDLCAGFVESGSSPALIVLAARRGVVFLHEAWGRLGSEPDTQLVQRDTIFGVASVSKVVTATAVMLLVEEGKIGLRRPVQEYIPEFVGEGKEKIWVRHLLTHTSGLRDQEVDTLADEGWGKVSLPPPEPTQDPGQHEWLHFCYIAPVWQPPETELVYCNYAYNLLGEIVRRVSGQSFNDFTRKHIFEPLGMKDAYFVTPERMRYRCIRRWPGITAPDYGDDYDSRDDPSPPSGLWATAMDNRIFGQTFLNNGRHGNFRLLSPATIAAMTRNQIPDIPRESRVPPCGLGWFIAGEAKFRDYPSLWSPNSYDHSGGSGAFLWVDPTWDLVGVFLFAKVQEEVRPLDLFINAVTGAITDG